MKTRVLLCGLVGVAALPLAATAAGATAAVDVERLAGPDRHATAAAVAVAAFPDGATDAVLARGDSFPDALAGSYLAGVVGGPVLLTAGDQLSDDASDALADLQVDTVHILGGTGAVSAAVASELGKDGYTVDRVAGSTRYATAAEIAGRGEAAGELDGDRTAIVASGEGFPDALAAGPLAASAGFPILLSQTLSLAPETASALIELDIEHVLVLGGTAAISDDVVADIAATGASTERLAGENRAATATKIADFAIERLTWPGAAAGLARGDAFPDGLAAGPLGGMQRAPILLTDPTALSAETGTWLTEHADTIAAITVFGGDAAVSDDALDAARLAAGGTASGFAVVDEPATTAIGATRTCTVVTPPDTTVELRLLPSSLVTAGADGAAPTFADADADGIADNGAPDATIREAAGRTVSPPSSRVDGVASEGEIDVVIGSEQYESVYLVAFTDAEGGTAQSLDVDEDGSPTDEVAFGCRTVFAPPEATLGSHAGTVVGSVDVDEGLFVDKAGTKMFKFAAGDVFSSEGANATQSDFEALLSQNDVVDISYTPGEGAASTFNVTDDTVLPTAAPSALATGSDVQVSFVIPDSNGGGTRYRVTRIRTHAEGDGCSSDIAATAVTVGITDASPYDDLAVADGCYIYRIIAVASSGLTASSPFSLPVETPGSPGAADTVRPLSSYASVADGGSAGVLGAGDTITVVFSEPMAAPLAGAKVTVSSVGSTATFTAGAGSTFSLNASAQTVAGQQRQAGSVLTIAISANPATPTSLPTELTAHAGITDQAGNTWDLATSTDRTLEAS